MHVLYKIYRISLFKSQYILYSRFGTLFYMLFSPFVSEDHNERVPPAPTTDHTLHTPPPHHPPVEVPAIVRKATRTFRAKRRNGHYLTPTTTDSLVLRTTPLIYKGEGMAFANSICCPPPFAKAGEIKTHSSVCLSVRLSQNL